MLRAGYQRQGGTWQRRSIIDSSLFGGTEYHGRTYAVRHTISYLVRKHFGTLMDKTINRVRR